MRLSLGDPPDTVVSAEDRDDRIIRERRFRMGRNSTSPTSMSVAATRFPIRSRRRRRSRNWTKHSAMYSTHSAHHRERILVLFNAMGVSNPRLRATS